MCGAFDLNFSARCRPSCFEPLCFSSDLFAPRVLRAYLRGMCRPCTLLFAYVQYRVRDVVAIAMVFNILVRIICSLIFFSSKGLVLCVSFC